MPHLHLSLQAGNDLILKRMKRRHSRAQAVAFAAEARRLRPDVVLGADLIAGFPTETEEQFLDTLGLLDDCELTFLHIFPFSARTGTPAARMPQLLGDVRRERAARLRVKAAERQTAYFSEYLNREVDVVVEQDNLSHSPHFVPIRVQGAALKPGSLVRVRTSAAEKNYLVAECI
jgi:threonylcarbamoyladenosine tRNA methylthiotransferase MtaB